jgi:hypothetical protein
MFDAQERMSDARLAALVRNARRCKENGRRLLVQWAPQARPSRFLT